MRKTVIAAVLTAGVLLGGPAIAEEVPKPAPARSAAFAAGLTVGAPVVLALLVSRTNNPAVHLAVPIAGLSVGHLYAGEPLRGALVTTACLVAGAGTFSLLDSSLGQAGQLSMAAGLVAFGVASSLAAWDAYQTVEANRQQARPR